MRTFDEAGIRADRAQVAALIGADGKKLAREIAEQAGRRISTDAAESIDRRSGELYDELNTNPQPTEGAQALLLALESSSLSWAIATSSLAAQVGVSVDALGLPRRPLIVDGSHVEHAKPAPDLLLLAAKMLGKHTAECWYVGDSTWDMRAAQAAGMLAVGVAYGAADESALTDAGADVVTTLTELETDLRDRGLLGS
jgi:HAD superfamily hydrolase (TIGR01509 family)